MRIFVDENSAKHIRLERVYVWLETKLRTEIYIVRMYNRVAYTRQRKFERVDNIYFWFNYIVSVSFEFVTRNEKDRIWKL